MKFDPADCLAVVNCPAHDRASIRIPAWLRGLGIPDHRIGFNPPHRDIVCAYNRGVREALKVPVGQFLFIDGDVQPGPAVGEFVASAADVVGAIYDTGNECAFDHPGTVHTGLWRTHRAVLERVAAPWFLPSYRADGSDWADCLCGPFCRRCRAAGFTVEAAGWAGHKPRATG